MPEKFFNFSDGKTFYNPQGGCGKNGGGIFERGWTPQCTLWINNTHWLSIEVNRKIGKQQ